MNLSDYIQLPREQRIAHIDLTQDCTCPPVRGETAVAKARKELLTLLDITSDIHGKHAQCCHACTNHSRSGSVCTNPYHLYLGTPRENQLDIDPSVRNARMEKMRTAAYAMRDEEYIANWVAMIQAAGQEKLTFEVRSAAGKLGSDRATPDVRSERSRKGWETRRRNKQGG